MRSQRSIARELDDELFYCGALVHDFGIAQPTRDRDFTLASAERMLACAAERRESRAIARS